MINYERIELDENLPIKLLYFYYDKQIHSKLKHWHRSLEIIIPIIGHTVLEEYDGKKANKIKIESGSFYIINSRNIHSFNSNNRSLIYEGYALQISYDYLKSLCNIDSYCFLQPDSQIKDEILTIIMTIIDEYESKDIFKSIIIRSHVDNLIYLLLKNLAQMNNDYLKIKSNKNSLRINKIINYINNHYNEEIKISEVSEYFGISRTYLAKFFKDNIGKSMKEYIIDVKLKHSIDDLLMTDYPIIDIAFNNGFLNIKSFNFYFKKKYHKTPKQYRKEFKNNT